MRAYAVGASFFNAVLGLGHIVVLSNVGGYAVLVPYAAGSLRGVLPSFALWANTHFMVGLALGFPIARWLSGRFGDYRLFIAAFAIYALASFLCAVSESLWLFLPARIVLGFAGGMSLPIGQALLVNEYPERIRSVGLGIWGVFTLMPFTIGIPLGGWIAENLGWRFLFYSNIPVALTVAGVTGSLLYGRGFHRRITCFDSIGFILLALILGATSLISGVRTAPLWTRLWERRRLRRRNSPKPGCCSRPPSPGLTFAAQPLPKNSR